MTIETPGAKETSSQHESAEKMDLDKGQDRMSRGLLRNYWKGLPARVGWGCWRQEVVGETSTLSHSPLLHKLSLILGPCYGSRMHGGW